MHFLLWGGIVKIFIFIPVSIELIALGIANMFVLLINSFAVLFTGNYWHIAYELNVGIMKMNTKVLFFFYGITNTYPGFSLSYTPDFYLELAYSQKPSHFFTIPIIGGLSRIIILIPYLLYSNIIHYAAMLGAICGSFWVLFQGKYPESIFEIVVDMARLEQSVYAYISGISDIYTSCSISMHHKAIKIILIILAILKLFGQNGYRASQLQRQQQEYKTYHYHHISSLSPQSKNSY